MNIDQMSKEKLIQEFYKLSSVNAELLRLCKWTLAVLDGEKWDTSLQKELREAIKN